MLHYQNGQMRESEPKRCRPLGLFHENQTHGKHVGSEQLTEPEDAVLSRQGCLRTVCKFTVL